MFLDFSILTVLVPSRLLTDFPTLPLFSIRGSGASIGTRSKIQRSFFLGVHRISRASADELFYRDGARSIEVHDVRLR